MLTWIVLTFAALGSIATPAPATPVASRCVTTANTGDQPGLPHYIIPGTITQDLPGTPAGTPVYPEPDEIYGENGIWVFLPEDGVFVPPMPHWVLADGSILWDKLLIYRDDSAAGTVEITGHLVDDPATVLNGSILGYGEVGLEIGSIVFPTTGCWTVEITSGDDRMTFTVIVRRP